MGLSDKNPLVIPYGTDGLVAGQLAVVREGDRWRIDCRVPHAVIRRDRRTPLRLNSGGIDFAEPPPLVDLPGVTDQIGFLSTHFQRHCGVWNDRLRLFVRRYFEFVLAEVAAHQDELARRLAPFGGLYAPDQWAFSALRPLPRALVPAPNEGGPADYTPATLVPVDCAFWTGDEIVAFELTGSDTRRSSDVARADRLTAAGVRRIELSGDVLASADDAGFHALLPAELQRFWEGEALPAGPFLASEPADQLPE